MTPLRTYPTLPPLPEAGPLIRYQDSLAVLVPYARTNLVTNPSVETNTTGYTAVGGAIARSTAQQAHGAYSLAVTPTAATTDGVYYGTISLVSGTTYAVSCKVRGAPGVTYKLSVATTGGADLDAVTFVGTGRWQWIWLLWTETSSTTRRIYVRKNGGTSTAVFYVDGLQVEACGSEGAFVTTYIDGDQPGLIPNQYPPAYGWYGVPHASTSYRSAQTRAGGRIVRFKDFGFLLSAIIGLGLATPQLQALDYAQLDGGQLQDIRKPTRQFSLVGRWTGMTPTQMQTARGQLGRLLDRDRTALRQPLTLTLQAEEAGAPIGERVFVQAAYAGGLEGQAQELPTGAGQATFTQFLPSIFGGDGGAALAASSLIGDANYIVRRLPSGVWEPLGTGANAQVDAIAIAPNGDVYAGGNFTDMGGTGADYLARWDVSLNAWSVVGSATALNGRVRALAFRPDGVLIVAGDFTNAGGVAAADYIATWSGSAWGALGTGANASVRALAVTNAGGIYAGGTFTDMGGTGADYLAAWDGSAWAVVSSATALNDAVYALAIGPDGRVYVGGAFTNAGGVADADYIAVWNGSAYAALGTGMNADVYALAFGPDGRLVAGGAFTTAGGATALRVAAWTGAGWQPLGSGTLNIVWALLGSPQGVYAGGQSSSWNGIRMPDRMALWSGGTWLPLDGNLSASSATYAFAQAPDGTLYIGFGSSGSVAYGNPTTVTNAGTAGAYPRVTFTGPSAGTSRIYQLTNDTTGAAIYLNYSIAKGEVLTLDLDPANLSFVSSFSGNILRAILPGSDLAAFALQPGANQVGYFYQPNLGALTQMTAVLDWPTTYLSLDDALYQQGAI